MNIKHLVELNDAEEKQLQELTSKGKVSARKIKREGVKSNSIQIS